MFRRTTMALTLLGLGLGGCNGLFPPPGTAETGQAGLKRFESQQELTDYFEGQVQARNQQLSPMGDLAFLNVQREGNGDNALGSPSSGVETPPIPGADAAPGPVSVDAISNDNSFSQTTTQEIGVDEADVVKTDGSYLYIISGETLKIVNVTPPENMATVASVPLTGFGREIYLVSNKVVAITESFGGVHILDSPTDIMIDAPVEIFAGADATGIDASPPVDGGAERGIGDGFDGDPGRSDGGHPDNAVNGDVVRLEPAIGEFPDPPPTEFARPKVYVTVIDVADAADPHVLFQTAYDGTPTSNRMIDGVLHLVVANFQTFYHDVLPALGTRDLNVRQLEVEKILPSFETVYADGETTSGPVLTWENLSRPIDPDGFGIVSVVSVDVNGDGSFSATGIMAEPGLVYSSRGALYLTDTNYDFSGKARETTDIYKIEYESDSTTTTAVGMVPGRILNQYSMGEYEGFLRVATTVGRTFSFDGQASEASNNVYVLEQTGDTLTVVGRVENIAPRETIQSARFIGDRGFVVTYELVDPLFTLDLSDPTDPRIAGELKVPGFSTFIVPMGADHLLTVGQFVPDNRFAPGGVQLSIFNVSDISNPTLEHSVILGEETGAWSEALFNPKAFTYFASQDMVALPISVFDNRFLPEPNGDFDRTFDDIGTEAGFVDGVKPADATVSMGDGPQPDSSVSLSGDNGLAADGFVRGGFDGLVVFHASVDQGFEEMGRLSTRFPKGGYSFASFTRGVFIDDVVFAVTNEGVRGGPMNALSDAPYELQLKPTTGLEPIGPPINLGPPELVTIDSGELDAMLEDLSPE